MEKYDVIVVGAGPAGSTAAYYTNGLNVLIVDRFDFPRHKACGGGLMSAGDWHLEFENFAAIKSRITSRYTNRTFRLYWQETFVAARRFKHFFDQVRREEFDHLLLQEALKKDNVTFRKFAMQSMRREEYDGVSGYVLSDGEREMFAHFVIGADGAQSRVATFLGNQPRKRHQYGICLEYDIVCDKVSDDVLVSAGYGGEIGYSWVFPTEKGYYVGLGMVRETREVMQMYLDRYLRLALERGWLPKDYTIARTFGAMIPLKVVKRTTMNNVLLCGDALGAVSILIGEGIYFAMKSGKIAGQTLSASQDAVAPRFRRAIRPLVREVSLTPYIPPRFLTVNFWAAVFLLWKPVERLHLRIFDPIIHFVVCRVLHRQPKQEGSFYADERLEWLGENDV